jgi:hypothetical protein
MQLVAWSVVNEQEKHTMVFTICLISAAALTSASWYFWAKGESDGLKWRRGATLYGLIIGSAAVLVLIVFLLRPLPHASMTRSAYGASAVLGWARAGFLLASLGLLVSVFGQGKVRVFVILAMGLTMVFWFKSLLLV